MGKDTRTKPKKPYPTFPLTAHPNGQWCKKIRGKVHFFGVWANPAAAEKRYLTLAADLHQGRQPRSMTLAEGQLTVKGSCNRFLTWQSEKLEAGEIGARWFEDCRKILKEFASSVGTARLVDDLRPEDFQRHRMKLARRVGVHALTRHITAIRSAFKYAYDVDLIDKPMKFGTGFAPPSAAQKRKAKLKTEVEHGKRLFSTKDVHKILKACGLELRGPVLLGLNGGFGNTDCSRLPRSAVDLDNAVIEYHREKTGIQRIVPLWPETVAELKKVIENRPTPQSEEVAKLVFRSPRGKPLIRQVARTEEGSEVKKVSNVDRLSASFGALLKTLGLDRSGIGFYTLRHTFRTWADETRDQHAIHRIMGHAIPGMSGIYVEEIGIERLRKVVDHVREKVFR